MTKSHQSINGGQYIRKPGIPFIQLITDALNSSDRGSFFLTEIYDYITSKYDYYKFSDDGWKNSIRHALSASDDFVKLPAFCDSGRRKCEWALNSTISNRVDGDYEGDYFYDNNNNNNNNNLLQPLSSPTPPPKSREISPIKTLKRISKKQSLLDKFPMLHRVDMESIRIYLGTDGSSLDLSSSLSDCCSDSFDYEQSLKSSQKEHQTHYPITLYSITDHSPSESSIYSTNTVSIMPPQNTFKVSYRITEIEELQSPLEILQRMSGFEPPGIMPSPQEIPTNQLPPYLSTSPLPK